MPKVPQPPRDLANALDEAGHNEPAKIDGDPKKAFEAVRAQYHDALEGYHDLGSSGQIGRLNEDGARELGGNVGDEWLSFSYMEEDRDPATPFHGYIDPRTGEVISTSEQHYWFD